MVKWTLRRAKSGIYSMQLCPWLRLLCTCMAVGCGQSVYSPPPIGDAGLTIVDGAVSCPPGLATPAELAVTPRAEINLELLALKLSTGRVVADQSIYDRVVRDVGAIRAQQPQLAGIKFFPRHDGRTLILTVPLATSDQMQQGSYHAWDCLNATFGAAMPFEFIRIGSSTNVFVAIKLKGIYAMERIAGEYRGLPGITGVDASSIGGDGPTICVTTSATTWHYVFDAASGDCPAGCTAHSYTHLTTESDGKLALIEAWSTEQGIAAPNWVGQYASLGVCD